MPCHDPQAARTRCDPPVFPGRDGPDSCSSRCRRSRAHVVSFVRLPGALLRPSHRAALQFDAVRVVEQAVADRVGLVGVADAWSCYLACPRHRSVGMPEIPLRDSAGWTLRRRHAIDLRSGNLTGYTRMCFNGTASGFPVGSQPGWVEVELQ